MTGKVFVSLLEALVFPDVVEVVPANDNRPFHLHTLHNTRQDPTTNGDIASEWALLVNIGSLDGLYGLVLFYWSFHERAYI